MESPLNIFRLERSIDQPDSSGINLIVTDGNGKVMLIDNVNEDELVAYGLDLFGSLGIQFDTNIKANTLLELVNAIFNRIESLQLKDGLISHLISYLIKFLNSTIAALSRMGKYDTINQLKMTLKPKLEKLFEKSVNALNIKIKLKKYLSLDEESQDDYLNKFRKKLRHHTEFTIYNDVIEIICNILNYIENSDH